MRRRSRHARDHPRQPRLDHPGDGAPDGAVRDVAVHQGEEGLLRRRLRHGRAHRGLPHLGERPRHARRRSSGRIRSRPCGRATSTGSTIRTSPTAPSSTIRTWSSPCPCSTTGGSSPSPRPSGTTRTSAGCARAASRRTPPRSITRACSCPPVRIVREGQLNEEAYRIFLRNSRLPDIVEGDTRAMMASCHLAEMRLGELFARYGATTVLAAFDECIAQTARARARAVPRARARGRVDLPRLPRQRRRRPRRARTASSSRSAARATTCGSTARAPTTRRAAPSTT